MPPARVTEGNGGAADRCAGSGSCAPDCDCRCRTAGWVYGEPSGLKQHLWFICSSFCAPCAFSSVFLIFYYDDECVVLICPSSKLLTDVSLKHLF